MMTKEGTDQVKLETRKSFLKEKQLTLEVHLEGL